MTRFLGGSDVGFAMPMGVFVGRNLTPAPETGLGKWTRLQIVAAHARDALILRAAAAYERVRPIPAPPMAHQV